MSKTQYADLTGQIIAAYYRVFNTLQHRQFYDKEDFAKALAEELFARGLQVQIGFTSPRQPDQHRSTKTAGLLVSLSAKHTDDAIPVLINKVRSLTRQHMEQLETCLRDGGWPVGVMVNFGSARSQARRLYSPDHSPKTKDDNKQCAFTFKEHL